MDAAVRTVEANGWEFTVRLGGPDDGPPVLLLHGFPTDGTCFDRVVQRLHVSGLHTIVPDQRGYSPRARPTAVTDYRLDSIVADAVAILDALEVGYAQVVGHDLGGLVGWHLAAQHSNRVTALVAVSTGHPSAMASALADTDADQRQRSSYIKDFVQPNAEDALLADGAARLRRLVPGESVVPLLQRDTMTAALAWYRANLSGDIAAGLACPPVEVPTTLVWGEGDAYLGREQAERTGRFVYSDYRFCPLPGIDHWVPERAPAALAAEIALRSAQF